MTTMSDTPNRQQNRGGGNRRPRRNNNRNRNRNNRNRPQQPPKPLKLTLWQKILKAIGLFDEEKARKQQQQTQKNTNKGTKSAAPKSNTRNAKSSTGGKRKPQRVPVESARLYVGNLSYDATEYDIEDLFKGIGTVKKVEIIYNRNTHKSKGYGFVQMLNTEEAKRAVEVLHDQPFMGRQLVVNGSKSRKDSDPAKEADNSEVSAS
ncbi:hypothetical protein Rhal01_01228 [Rubritalea halochordaticola]|uniref:RRM domain-containing protein n=2 Tax=Rubritalea halochordaticola TaxID=714537 RepID=A0ABP9UXT2_9BACT